MTSVPVFSKISALRFVGCNLPANALQFNQKEVFCTNPIQTGNLIRTLRQRRGLTQKTLAEQIGVSDKAVSKWERGCGLPDPALLSSLAEALDGAATEKLGSTYQFVL